jgi:hypothetical protein
MNHYHRPASHTAAPASGQPSDELDEVMVRSYAEWCGVVDVLIAAQLIFLM